MLHWLPFHVTVVFSRIPSPTITYLFKYRDNRKSVTLFKVSGNEILGRSRILVWQCSIPIQIIGFIRFPFARSGSYFMGRAKVDTLSSCSWIKGSWQKKFFLNLHFCDSDDVSFIRSSSSSSSELTKSRSQFPKFANPCWLVTYLRTSVQFEKTAFSPNYVLQLSIKCAFFPLFNPSCAGQSQLMFSRCRTFVGLHFWTKKINMPITKNLLRLFLKSLFPCLVVEFCSLNLFPKCWVVFSFCHEGHHRKNSRRWCRE